MIDGLGINVVSLYVALEGHQEAEAEITDYAGFYDRLRASDEGATTSRSRSSATASAYQPLLAAQRDDRLDPHLGRDLRDLRGRMQARQRLIDEDGGGERIHVYDSHTGAGGMGLVAIAAARVAASGADGAAVVERAKATAGKQMWFAVETLEYRRGGRIGAARALLGSTLKIKPILTLDEEITPVDRVRTRKRAFEAGRVRARAALRRRRRLGRPARTGSRHGVAPRRRVPQIFGSEPEFVSEIGPVLGAHVGPGLIGIGGLPRSALG